MVAEVEKRAIAVSTPLIGITKQQLAIELFRLEPVKAGYYLADLRHKQFYYYRTEPESVKLQLRSLGIVRNDSMEH